jgi:hypothetical protein
MPKRDRVEEAADELYSLTPGEFTRARDERAKALRAEGDREAANAVKALRKPTVAAWALNQLARTGRKDLDRLLAAGEELRAAQEELLAGGDRTGLQKAAARERDLVAKLSAAAASLAGEAGESGTGLQDKVATTLHAAALDEETAEELQAGRLTREREAIGGFGELGGAPAPPRRASSPGSKSPQRPSSSARKPKAQKRSSSSGKQDREDAERRQRLAGARTDERHARRELDAAERAVQHAEERAAAAEAHAKEASERARTTAERLKEAKRAQAAARKSHTRAERALAKAEDASS